MTPRSNRSADLVLIAIVASFSVLLIGVSLLLLANARQMGRLLLQYDTSRLASVLLEEYVESSELYFSDLSDRVLGAGIYAMRGSLLQGAGDLPPAIVPPGPGLEGGRYEFNRPRRQVTLIRPIQIESVLDARLPAPPSGVPLERPGPDPRMRMANRGYVFVLRADATSYFQSHTWYTAGMVLAPVLIGTLGFAVGIVLVRARRRVDELAGREELARLGEGARTIAHEIRNPLNAIRIRTRVLRNQLPADAEVDLDAIENEVDRLRRLSDRVGDFLRDPLGEPVKVRLRDAVASVCERHRWNAILTCEPPNAAPTVVFDETRLESVLVNVLANAADVQPDGEPLAVRILRSGNGVTLEVSDQGPGMTSEELARAFDPFFTTKTHGSGVGLAVVKRFVEAAGAHIRIDAGTTGTTVTTVFPGGTE